MAGFIKLEVKRLPVQAINTKINSEIFGSFQRRCKEQNIPMNVVIEAFARQYAYGRYELSKESILKWKGNIDETSILNTPINKDVYYRFKDTVKTQKLFVKHVLSAFIEDYGKNNLELEFIRRDK